MQRDHILLCFDARLFLDHVRKAKNVPTSKVKIHANTIPAMAPEFNDDVEKVLLFCDRGASEDVGGDKVDEDGDTEEARDIEGVGVGVDFRDDEELILLRVTVVVVFNEMLVRLIDWTVVECEGVDVETSDRISMTVVVVGEVGKRSPVSSPLLTSPMGRTTIDQCDELTFQGELTIGELKVGWSFEDLRSQSKRLPAV